jgi:membrane protein
VDLHKMLTLDGRRNALTAPLQRDAARDEQTSPLWSDLLLATGLIGFAYALDRLIRPSGARHFSSKADKTENTDRNLAASAAGSEASTDIRETSPDINLRRAEQGGRGRSASAPTEIPVMGWKDILWRVYWQLQEDRLLAVAAGAVFYMLLALFPAVTALVSLYGLFADPVLINEHLSLLAGVMPEAGLAIIREQITRLAATSSDALSLGFLLGLGLALWSANAGMKAIIDALNVVYDEREKRSFLKLTLVSFAFTFGGLAFVILAIVAVVVAPLVLAWIGLKSHGLQILSVLRWPSLFLIVLLWLAVLYRFAPSRTLARWEWLSVGSLAAAAAWLAGSAPFPGICRTSPITMPPTGRSAPPSVL